MTRIENEAKKAGLTLAQAIEESASHEWRGFKAEWLESAKAKTSTPTGNRGHMPHNGFDKKDYSDTAMDD
jgi:hypothetical protein